MLLQQPIRLPEGIYLSGYICAPALLAVVARWFGCNKAALIVDGRIHLSLVVGSHAAKIRVQPNNIAKWSTFRRQLPPMPC